jgi:DNA-binding transcriptional LysR family regulator
MHTACLCIVQAVLAAGSVRGAARQLGLPISTVATAVRRLETEIAVPLLQRGSGRAFLLPMAERIRPELDAFLARLQFIARLVDPDVDAAGGRHWAVRTPLSLLAIGRFVDVAQRGSISSVAHAIGIGQPQLSRQISDLEAILGGGLLDRSPAGVTMTERGRAALASFAILETIWRGLRSPAKARFSRSSRTLRVGSILQTGPDSWIARGLAQVIADWSRTEGLKPISLVSMPADSLREAIKSRLIDVAIIDSIFGLDGFASRRFGETDLVVIAPPGSSGNSLAELAARHPICVTSSRTGLGQALSQIETDFGLDFLMTPMVEVESLPVLVNLVARHGFISLLGRSSVAAILDRVRVVELAHRVPFVFHLVWRDSPAAKAVAAEIARRLEDLDGHRHRRAATLERDAVETADHRL